MTKHIPEISDKISEGLAEYRRKVEAGEIERAKPEHNQIKKLLNRPNSMKAAVNAMCFGCFGGGIKGLPDPGWKEEIRNCSAWPPCSLHDFRPYKKKEGEESYTQKMERWKKHINYADNEAEEAVV